MAAASSNPSQRFKALALLILGLIFVFHAPGLFGGLFFDDAHAIVENIHLKKLTNIPGFFADPTQYSTTGKMYRPLVLSTLALEHWTFGGAAWGFKLGNLLQHLLVCSLAFFALRLLYLRAGLETFLAERASLVCVLIFGLHPLHVESLDLVSSRTEILVGLGFVTSLLTWLHFGAQKRTRAQVIWLCVGTVVACLSKEIGIFVPPVIFLMEYLLPYEGRTARLRFLAVRVAPSCAVVALFLYLRNALFGLMTIPMHSMHMADSDPYSGGTRSMLDQLLSMGWYLPKAVSLWLFPWRLNVDHTRFPEQFSVPLFCGFAFIFSCLLLAVLLHRKRALLSFGILAACAFALPWILIPLNVPLAEHRLYLPIFFFGIPFAAFLIREHARFERTARLPQVVLVLITLFLGIRSTLRHFDWMDRRKLWGNSLVQNSRSFRALNGLGQAYIESGDLHTARRYLERCVQVYPKYVPGVENLGEVRVRLMEEIRDKDFHDSTVTLIEQHLDGHWKDPFLRLLAARARSGRYQLSKDPEDLRFAVSWALSPLAMVAPKMLVYRTAAEILVRSGDPEVLEEALVQLSMWKQHQVEVNNVEALQIYHALEARTLLTAGHLDAAALSIRSLPGAHPLHPLQLSLYMRLHAARNDGKAWRRCASILRGMGYGIAELPRPASLPAVAK